MWDPRNFSDSDFGLDANERFEPDEIDESQIDVLCDRHVMTVFGPIEPAALGITLPAEHLLTGGDEAESDLRLDDVAKAIEELTSFVTAGGKSIVEMTLPSQGRDMLGLLDVARRVPAHLICSTSVEVGLESMTREIVDGIGPRRIRPGVIQVRDVERHLEDSIEAAKATGLPLCMHVSDAGMSPTTLRDISGTSSMLLLDDLQTEIGMLQDLLAQGLMILFSGIGRHRDRDLEFAPILVQLAAGGYGDQLLVSQTVRRRSSLHAWGGQPGLVHLLERFTLLMMEAGAGVDFVRSLLIDNPARALTIEPIALIDPA